MKNILIILFSRFQFFRKLYGGKWSRISNRFETGKGMWLPKHPFDGPEWDKFASSVLLGKVKSQFDIEEWYCGKPVIRAYRKEEQ